MEEKTNRTEKNCGQQYWDKISGSYVWVISKFFSKPSADKISIEAYTKLLELVNTARQNLEHVRGIQSECQHHRNEFQEIKYKFQRTKKKPDPLSTNINELCKGDATDSSYYAQDNKTSDQVDAQECVVETDFSMQLGFSGHNINAAIALLGEELKQLQDQLDEEMKIIEEAQSQLIEEQEGIGREIESAMIVVDTL